MPEFIVGSVVRDDDFFFREEFIQELWEALRKHNVLLLAPRRIGKTSVMYRLLDDPLDQWLVIHLNVEDLKSPAEFFIHLIDALQEHQPEYVREALVKTWDFLRGVFSKIRSIEAFELKVELRKSENLKNHWQERGTQLMERIFNSSERVLFIIDELPDMLNNMSEDSEDDYETFLHWFRKLRERSLKTKVRWLVGGSVNLVGTLDSQGKTKLMNDLKAEVLPPFTEREVERFVTTALEERSVDFDTTVVPRILELLGSPIPFFLQLLTQELYRYWKRHRDTRLTADSVDQVFRKALLGEMARDKLQHFRTRIDVHYPHSERPAVCDLLDQLSASKEGISRKTLFQYYRQVEETRSDRRTGPFLKQAFDRLLLRLQSDFYIEDVDDNRYDFTSRLLKTWWRKYYGYETNGA